MDTTVLDRLQKHDYNSDEIKILFESIKNTEFVNYFDFSLLLDLLQDTNYTKIILQYLPYFSKGNKEKTDQLFEICIQFLYSKRSMYDDVIKCISHLDLQKENKLIFRSNIASLQDKLTDSEKISTIECLFMKITSKQEYSLIHILVSMFFSVPYSKIFSFYSTAIQYLLEKTCIRHTCYLCIDLIDSFIDYILVKPLTPSLFIFLLYCIQHSSIQGFVPLLNQLITDHTITRAVLHSYWKEPIALTSSLLYCYISIQVHELRQTYCNLEKWCYYTECRMQRGIFDKYDWFTDLPQTTDQVNQLVSSLYYICECISVKEIQLIALLLLLYEHHHFPSLSLSYLYDKCLNYPSSLSRLTLYCYATILSQTINESTFFEFLMKSFSRFDYAYTYFCLVLLSYYLKKPISNDLITSLSAYLASYASCSDLYISQLYVYCCSLFPSYSYPHHLPWLSITSTSIDLVPIIQFYHSCVKQDQATFELICSICSYGMCSHIQDTKQPILILTHSNETITEEESAFIMEIRSLLVRHYPNSLNYLQQLIQDCVTNILFLPSYQYCGAIELTSWEFYFSEHDTSITSITSIHALNVLSILLLHGLERRWMDYEAFISSSFYIQLLESIHKAIHQKKSCDTLLFLLYHLLDHFKENTYLTKFLVTLFGQFEESHHKSILDCFQQYYTNSHSKQDQILIQLIQSCLQYYYYHQTIETIDASTLHVLQTSMESIIPSAFLSQFTTSTLFLSQFVDTIDLPLITISPTSLNSILLIHSLISPQSFDYLKSIQLIAFDNATYDDDDNNNATYDDDNNNATYDDTDNDNAIEDRLIKEKDVKRRRKQRFDMMMKQISVIAKKNSKKDHSLNKLYPFITQHNQYELIQYCYIELYTRWCSCSIYNEWFFILVNWITTSNTNKLHSLMNHDNVWKKLCYAIVYQIDIVLKKLEVNIDYYEKDVNLTKKVIKAINSCINFMKIQFPYPKIKKYYISCINLLSSINYINGFDDIENTRTLM